MDERRNDVSQIAIGLVLSGTVWCAGRWSAVVGEAASRRAEDEQARFGGEVDNGQRTTSVSVRRAVPDQPQEPMTPSQQSPPRAAFAAADGRPPSGSQRSPSREDGSAIPHHAPTPSSQGAGGARRRRRLRRTVFVALAALLGGTLVARASEDPGTVLAAGAVASVVTPEAGVDGSAAAVAPSAAAPASGGGQGDASTPSGAPTTVAAGSAGAGKTSARKPTGSSGTAAAPGTAHADSEDGDDPGAGKVTLAVPASGTGTLSALAIPVTALKAAGRTVTYSVEVENGLGVLTGQFAATVQRVLADPRGWQTEDGVRFVPVSPLELAAGASPQIRVTLASPTLTARLCAPLNVSAEQVSCWNNGRAVLNLTRWIRGATTYGAGLAAYRQYLVNHEVGHGIGHLHEHCPAAGHPAPVMVQQTKSLEGCTAWPWPTAP